MRLTRSRDDVIVAGVLAGLGEYYKIDPTLLRVGFVVLAFLGVGFVIPLYLIAAVIIPKAPNGSNNSRRAFNRKTSEDMKSRRTFDRVPSSNESSSVNKDEQSTKAKEIKEDDWSDF